MIAFANEIREALHRAEFNRRVEESIAKMKAEWKECIRCGDRCPTVGESGLCVICSSQPTAEDMRIIIY